MGRPRGGRFADRPANVEITTRAGTTYFTYCFPDGQRRAIGNSNDAPAAYAKATALNGYFAQQRVDVSSLVARARPRATPKNPTIPTLIEEFRKHDPKRKRYAQQTAAEQDYILNRYAATWEDKTACEIETTDVTKVLNELSDNAYVKHRAALLRLFQFAGHQGYRSDNPVAVTLVKTESKKVRQRHTWDGYVKIRDAKTTPEFVRLAMPVALYSLQRREDIVLIHRSAIDLDRRTITVLQRKTRNYKNPVFIDIEMGTQLFDAVQACLRSEILCPYLIREKPKRTNAKQRKAKPHHFAVTADHLTREFSKARDKCGAYAELPPEQRPTLHELRALGLHLYKEAGYSAEYRMALSGHADEKMLERYEKDHEQVKPRLVSAGLTAAQLPK